MSITATVDGQTVTWRDHKRYLWLLGIVVPLLPLGAWRESTRWDLDVFWWLGPIWVLSVIPLLDAVLGQDRSNPPEWAVDELARDRFYRWCTFLYLPVQYASLVLACWVVTHVDMSLVDRLGYALTVGTVAGVAINTAHELGHKREAMERWLGRVALAQTGYGHFFIEHNRGHHVRVATPEDPASSRMGESFWAFLPRTVSGSLRSAWGIEAARLDRLGVSHWSYKNDILSAWAMTVLLFGGLAVAFGPVVLPYLIVQAVVGFSLLEVVNYLEHYGLLRQRKDDGRYERCQQQHSWNSNNVASNVLLFHLQRHSDHHTHPTRRYQALRHAEEAPQLPTGYAGMIVLALFPPVWRRVMDPRLLAHYDGDVSRINMQPRARRRIEARYGSAS